MLNLLFVCSQNKLRSPTAEQIFANHPGVETASAGTNNNAEERLSAEVLQWADIIFVMERNHRAKLQRRYRDALKSARVICLDIPDNFAFMDDALVALLRKKVTPFLP